ncbi:MAG: hypothetical protein K2X99_00395 [Gemmatimonadaceae bacterium]|nr:hypothetical protein [Gemmatimonadaceae bacterium]
MLLPALVTVLIQGAAPSPASAAPPAIVGVWETRRMNAKPLPFTDIVKDADGTTHAVRLIEMIIRVRKDGRFVATLKYQRTVNRTGARVENEPLLKDTWAGPWTLDGTRITFRPEKNKGRAVRPFQGTFANGRIAVPFDYDIVVRKTYQLDLIRNDLIL